LNQIDQGDSIDESPEDFSRRSGLPFTNIFLLTRALTHRSYLNEHPESLEDNERLEFLGDAVLDFLAGAWLYQHFPEMNEGELTRLRSALVRTERLAEFAKQLGLGAAMRLGRGENQAGGRLREPLLCATFEALVGALYLDSGLNSVRCFVEPLLENTAHKIISMRADQDAKSLLQELIQSKGFGPPQYRTISTLGPEHDKMFEVEVLIDGQVMGSGSGHSKQAAAKEAARQVLEKIESE
jgi:ribonuclease-3